MPPGHKPIVVFYDKEFIIEAIGSDEIPDDVKQMFKSAINQCEPYEEAGLIPIIGYCAEPQSVFVTSVERMRGMFIQ